MYQRNLWGIMKNCALIVFCVASIGSMMYTVSVNRELKLQVDTILKKNDFLTNRFKRSIVTSNQVGQLREESIRVKRAPGDGANEGGGVTYTRWGRRECSGSNNDLIYHGIAAGAYFTHIGGAANHLCLHLNVTYSPGKYQNGGQGVAPIHGMEYRDTAWVNNLLDLSLTEGTLQYHSVPCAICLARAKVNQLMIPGRETCPGGWSMEYTGYIMSGGHSDKHSSNAICVDDTPQVVPGTEGNQNGAYLHMVETDCRSLLCEPFVDLRELRCVVCTI